MELNAAAIVMVATGALIVGIVALVFYKVRVRGEHVEDRTLNEVVKLLTFIVVMPILIAFQFKPEEGSWTPYLAIGAAMLVVGSLFYWALGRK